MSWMTYVPPSLAEIEYIRTPGIYFCKITDAKLQETKTGKTQLRLRLCTHNNECYDAAFTLTSDAIKFLQRILWNETKKISPIGLTHEQLNDITAEALIEPEVYTPYILDYAHKYIVGKLVKVQLVNNTPKDSQLTFLNIANIRPMNDAEIVQMPNIQAVNIKFPKDKDTDEHEYVVTENKYEDDVPF